MNPSRGVDFTELAASAGTIASSSGSDTAAPMPLMNVRRSSFFFERNIALPLLLLCLVACLAGRRRARLCLCLPHLERRALHHAEHQRTELVVVLRRLTDDAADDGKVEVLDVASNGVHQELLGHG